MFLIELSNNFLNLSIQISSPVNLCLETIGESVGTTNIMRSFYIVCVNNEAQDLNYYKM